MRVNFSSGSKRFQAAGSDIRDLVKTTVQARDPLLGGCSSKRPGVSSQGRGGYVRDQGPQANGGGGHIRDQRFQGKGAGGGLRPMAGVGM